MQWKYRKFQKCLKRSKMTPNDPKILQKHVKTRGWHLNFFFCWHLNFFCWHLNFFCWHQLFFLLASQLFLLAYQLFLLASFFYYNPNNHNPNNHYHWCPRYPQAPMVTQRDRAGGGRLVLNLDELSGRIRRVVREI